MIGKKKEKKQAQQEQTEKQAADIPQRNIVAPSSPV
jgi:hypothetical protein